MRGGTAEDWAEGSEVAPTGLGGPVVDVELAGPEFPPTEYTELICKFCQQQQQQKGKKFSIQTLCPFI